MTNKLTTNFNVEPYYDDYDEEKNFYRILFKPSYAVQARELTQIQTMIQKQIERFGEHVFKEGSLVFGGEISLDTSLDYIKIIQTDETGNLITSQILNNLVDTTIFNSTSNVHALVTNVLAKDNENGVLDHTIFIRYINSGVNQEKTFFNDEVLTEVDSGFQFRVANTTNDTLKIGQGSAVKINSGVIFTKGFFVYFPSQTLILDPYSTKPTYRIGFNVEEEIVDHLDDITLTSPAQGSYNYAAPGADRLRITATLTKKTFFETVDDNFKLLLEVRNGQITKKYENSQYNILAKEFARRTSEESGDYTVFGYKTYLRNHLNTGNNNGYLTAAEGGNTQKLAVMVDAGKAYVSGYEIENLSKEVIEIDKGIDTAKLEDRIISMNYGNYVYVKEFSGICCSGQNVNIMLINSAPNSITSRRFSNTTGLSTNAIGVAKLKAFEIYSGNPGDPDAVYKLYFGDITMTNASFDSVKGFYIGNPTSANAVGDIVLDGGIAKLKESSFNSSIFKLPVGYAKTLRSIASPTDNDNQYQTFRTFTNQQVATNGYFSISTGSPTSLFEVTTGTYNQSQKNNILFLFGAAANSKNVTTVNTYSNTTTLQTNTAKFSVGDEIYVYNTTPANTGPYLILSKNNTHLTVNSTLSFTASNVNTYMTFKTGKVYNLGADYVTLTANNGGQQIDGNIGIKFSTSANVTIKAPLYRIDGYEKAKHLNIDAYTIIDTSTHSANNTGPWTLGVPDVFRIKEIRKKTSGSFASFTDGSDVTNNFELDTGQRDAIYYHGAIKKKSNYYLEANSILLVKFDYFEHDLTNGTGFFSVDSYPVNDTTPSNTEIRTEQIPVYVSSSGETFKLRDCLDFRTAETETANSLQLGLDVGAVIGDISNNPARANTYITSGSGLGFPMPNKTFTTDVEHYLPRKDIITLNKNGNINVIKGVSSPYPITPNDATDAMTLARIDVAPYPSLTKEEAVKYNLKDYSCSVKNIDNKRFTMRDIGVLKNRIENLEYYVSASLLEKETVELKILDANGLDRFKNGILIDSFSGHNVGDVYNLDYKCAIDPERRELRPRFDLDSVPLKLDESSTVNVTRKTNDVILELTSNVATSTVFVEGARVYQGSSGSPTANGAIRMKHNNTLYVELNSGQISAGSITCNTTSIGISSFTTPNNGNLLTLKYEQIPLISQKYATGTRNLASLNWLFKGIVTLTPNNDYWVDTTTNPTVTINIDNNYDGWLQLSNAMSSYWNSWETVVPTYDVGDVPVDIESSNTTIISSTNYSTVNGTVIETRTGERLDVRLGDPVRQSISSITNVGILPYIRARTIRFDAIGLKPFTNMFVFFDNYNVTNYCTTLDGSKILTTDAYGNLSGFFAIPNNSEIKFNVGTKLFRLIDNGENRIIDGRTISYAEAEYYAGGLETTTQDTVISTQKVEIIPYTVTDTRVVTYPTLPTINTDINTIVSIINSVSANLVTVIDSVNVAFGETVTINVLTNDYMNVSGNNSNLKLVGYATSQYTDTAYWQRGTINSYSTNTVATGGGSITYTAFPDGVPGTEPIYYSVFDTVTSKYATGTVYFNVTSADIPAIPSTNTTPPAIVQPTATITCATDTVNVHIGGSVFFDPRDNDTYVGNVGPMQIYGIGYGPAWGTITGVYPDSGIGYYPNPGVSPGQDFLKYYVIDTGSGGIYEGIVNINILANTLTSNVCANISVPKITQYQSVPTTNANFIVTQGGAVYDVYQVVWAQTSTGWIECSRTFVYTEEEDLNLSG